MALEGLSPQAFRHSEIFHNLNDKGPASFDSIRKGLDDNFHRGDIDKSLYETAILQLEELEKASKGEGSKGGKIIGHTRSGKAVYAVSKSNSYDSFSSEDHRDAAGLHREESSKVRQRASHPDNDALANHHWQVASGHFGEAEKKEKARHEDSLHPDEKRIIAEDKKKRAEEHSKNHDLHRDIADHIGKKHGKDNHAYKMHDNEANYHKSQKEHYSK